MWTDKRVLTAIAALAVQISHLDAKVTKVMSTESDLEAGLAALKTDFEAYAASVSASFATLKASIADLQAQVAAGSIVTQAQVDSLVAASSALDAEIKAAPTS